MSDKRRIDQLKTRILPEHVAILLDSHSAHLDGQLPRLFEKLDEIQSLYFELLRIKHVSIFNLPSETIGEYANHRTTRSDSGEIKFKILGDSSHNGNAGTSESRHLLTLVANHESRQEILSAVKKIARLKLAGNWNGQPVDTISFRTFLDSAELPDPDLVIRTAGNRSFQNVLLWQLAYAEFWDTDKPLPELMTTDLIAALEDYQQRERRYGNLVKIA